MLRGRAFITGPRVSGRLSAKVGNSSRSRARLSAGSGVQEATPLMSPDETGPASAAVLPGGADPRLLAPERHDMDNDRGMGLNMVPMGERWGVVRGGDGPMRVLSCVPTAADAAPSANGGPSPAARGA
jgi:hypothetical protein